jgi:hypothetical protein
MSLLSLPNEIITVVIGMTSLFDDIMLRTTCTALRKLVAAVERFPRHFVLDQQKCLEYYVTLGSVSALKYLKSMKFFFTTQLCERAAEVGQLDALKYMIKSGCALNSRILSTAALKGHLAVLICILQSLFHDQNEYKLKSNWQHTLFAEAAFGGHFHIVKYLHESGYQWDINIANAALKSDHPFEVFKYVVENGCQLKHDPCSGDLDLIKYLQARGLPWKRGACSAAAARGNLDALKFAHENGAKWEDVVATSASYGSLNCLKYALENGAPLTEIYLVATLEVAKYLVEHNVPLSTSRLYTNAIERRQKDVVEYLLENTTIKLPQSLAVDVASLGDLDFLKFAIEKGFNSLPRWLDNIYGDLWEDIYKAIISAGSLDCLKYAVETNFKMLYTAEEYFQSMFRTSGFSLPRHWK